MKTVFKILIPVVILVICGMISKSIFDSFEEVKRPAPPAAVKLVRTDVVRPSTNTFPITAFGKLVSSSPVDLISEVEGSLMSGDIRFIPGQNFRAGDVLLRIDDRQAQLNLNSSKSDFLNALATVLPEIKIDFPDKFPVWEAYFNSCGFDSELAELPEVRNQKIKLFLSRFNVYKLYFSIKRLEIEIEKHFVRAPFNGSITSTDLRVGSPVRAGSRLGRIISLDQVEVEVAVPAENVAAIDRSEPVRLTSSEMDGEWTGRITRIGTVLDERTQSVPVYVSLSGMDRRKLYDGVFLRAEFSGSPIENSVVVPRKAVYENRYVYTVDQGVLRESPIEIGRSLDENLIVRGGLNDGDVIVVDVLQGAFVGMRVKAITPQNGAENTSTRSEPQTSDPAAETQTEDKQE